MALSPTGNTNITNDQILKFISGANSADSIYAAAQKHGVSEEQIKGALAGTPGAAQKVDSYLANRPTTGLLDTSTSASQTQPAYADPRAASLFGAGNPNISNTDILNYMGSATSADDIYNTAIKHGVSAEQVRNAVSGTPGAQQNVDDYLAKMNQTPLDQGGFDRTMVPRTSQARQPPLAQFRPTKFHEAVRDPVHGTVAGNLNQVLDPNSPLMQRAASMGMQQANQRGLLNSSLGISAAQNAMVDAGLQIATPDAASHNQFGLANMQERNLTGRFSAENALKAGMFNADLIGQTDRFNVGQANEILARTMDHSQQTRLASLNNKYAAELEGSRDFNRAYQQMASNIAAIEANPDMSPDAKQSAINNQMELMAQFGSVTRALTNSGLAESFGANVRTHGAAQPGAEGQPGAAQPGTTSKLTGEPLGPVPNDPNRFGTLSGSISTAAANAIQQVYGIDPQFVASIPNPNIGTANDPYNLSQPGNPETQQQRALWSALTAALQAGTVHSIPLTEPKMGEWYSPELRQEVARGGAEGIAGGNLFYDPDNVLGLR